MTEIELNHVFFTAVFCALVGVTIIKMVHTPQNPIEGVIFWILLFSGVFMALMHMNETGILPEIP